MTRKEALAAGLPHYFTGKPCKRGHVSARTTERGMCLECSREWAAERYASDPKAAAEISRRWREKNPGYADANRDRINANSAKHRRSNLTAGASYAATRRARKAKATPRWFSELDRLVMSEAERLAKHRARSTWFRWDVDHIVPIAGQGVCGLHVGINIQVIPASLNNRKSNRLPVNQQSLFNGATP